MKGQRDVLDAVNARDFDSRGNPGRAPALMLGILEERSQSWSYGSDGPPFPRFPAFAGEVTINVCENSLDSGGSPLETTKEDFLSLSNEKRLWQPRALGRLACGV